MRRKGPPSEIARLVAPLAHAIDAAWQRMHWWIATMALLYALSGITVVRPDETALILRWGHVVGDTPALQVHGAGLLFAYPRPMDEVIRASTKRVQEVSILTLTSADMLEGVAAGEEEARSGQISLNPITDGYALTGDHNIVQVDMAVRYRVRDLAAWLFYGPRSDDVLRAEVTAAMVQSLGEMGVDRVLSDGRKELVATATRRAQAALDAAQSGLELTSLELRKLTPPGALTRDFSAVQSAFIDAETAKQTAVAFAASVVPQASAQSDSAVQAATADAATNMARARGEAEAFRALDTEYRANPSVVRERLYRDVVDQVLGAARVLWVPPPVGGTYAGHVRITLGAGGVPAPRTNAPADPSGAYPRSGFEDQ